MADAVWRRVRVDFWTHQKIQPLSSLARLVFLRFITGGHGSCVERVSERQLLRQLGHDVTHETMIAAIGECVDRGMLYWDRDEEIFWAPEGADEQGFTSGTRLTSLQHHLAPLPSHSPVIRAARAKYLGDEDPTSEVVAKSADEDPACGAGDTLSDTLSDTVSDTIPTLFPSESASLSESARDRGAGAPTRSPRKKSTPKRKTEAWLKRSHGLSDKQVAEHVVGWISAARGRCGINVQPVPITQSRIKAACKPIDGGFTLADWWTVIHRQEVNCRRDGIESVRNYLTLPTMQALEKTWERRLQDVHIEVPPMPTITPGQAPAAPQVLEDGHVREVEGRPGQYEIWICRQWRPATEGQWEDWNERHN